MTAERLTPSQLEPYRRLTTCIAASAIETFNVRLRNTGFADARIRCFFPEMPSMIGYAATARIRSASPPMEGQSYYVRTDWWNHIHSMPEPRVIVIEDIDHPAGVGAFVGQMHACILKALGCVGVVTNGAVRDLSEVQGIGFHLFAGDVAVSHAYAHVFDFGGTVEVGGLKVHPGDLLHGDLHGVLSVPLEIAARVPAEAEEIRKKSEALRGCCCAEGFTMTRLRETLKEVES